MSGVVLDGREDGTRWGVNKLAGGLARGEGGPWMQPLGFIQGLIPRPRGSDSGRVVSSVLHTQFCRHRSEEHVKEAGVSPSGRPLHW